MTRYLLDLREAWRGYRLVHTISSRLAGYGLIVFCCLCFWLIFERAEPTTIALALLAFISACGMFLNAGQKGLDSWTRRRGLPKEGGFTPPPPCAGEGDDSPVEEK